VEQSQVVMVAVDATGAVVGTYYLRLNSLCPGSLVRTTAELVMGLLREWRFHRELDPATGYDELQIRELPERGEPGKSL
jgi:hypothetical protein